MCLPRRFADVEVPNAATDGISCIAWSPTANFLAAGSWDNQIRCWEVQPDGNAVLPRPNRELLNHCSDRSSRMRKESCHCFISPNISGTD